MGGNVLQEVKNSTAVFQGVCPPKSKFSTDQIPDLTGRVIIVTGRATLSYKYF